MKRFLLIFLMIMLILVGCQIANTTENKKPLDDSYNVEVSIKVTDLDKGGAIYSGKYRSIYIEKNDSIIRLSDNLSSYPEVSPNNSKMAYIDSFDFETIGNLYVYDFATEENTQLTTFDYSQSETVKLVRWLDDDNILVIIGFAFGTITQGGDLYLYNLKEGALSILIASENLMEIKGVEIMDDKIILTKVIWKDSNYMEYENIEEEKSIKDFISR